MVRRLTADLRKDLAAATGKKRILVNRLLFDRGFVNLEGDSATTVQSDV